MRRLSLFLTVTAMSTALTACSVQQPAAPGVTETLSETVSEAPASETTAGSETAAPAGYQQISQEEAKALMKRSTDYIILDVRRQDEFDVGHIPGAVLVPNESITDTPPAELPDKNQMILIYCRSGNRSKQAAEKLAKMGYTNLFEFGGINTWDGTIVTSSEHDQLPADTGADDGWKAAYRSILSTYQNTDGAGDEISEIRWDLHDLDNDGTSELLISEGLFHVASVLYYYYEDGNAQQLLDDSGEPLHYGVYGEVMICPEESLLAVGNMHMGYNSVDMERYEHHRLNRVVFFMEDSGAVGEENVTYTVNDETVDKAAYDAAYDEFNARNWTLVGRQFALDELSALE